MAGIRRVAALLVACLAVAVLAACSARGGAGSSAPSSKSAPSRSLKFGPVYPINNVTDPLVARALQGLVTTKSVSGAEIRGYLVDWVVRGPELGTESIWESAVMKDGSLYRRPARRPAAAFMQVAAKRLEPESLREATAREAAVAVAEAWVDKYRSQFATVTPTVYGYFLRIHHKDGSYRDVWVDPDVPAGRFYDAVLTTLTAK